MMHRFPSAARSRFPRLCLLRASAIGALLAQTVWLGGCATSVDCGDAIARATAAGAEAEWLATTLRRTPTACREGVIDAWLEAAAPACSGRFAFSAARFQRHQASGACGGENFVSAANLGRMLGELERERDIIELRLSAERLSAEDRRALSQRRVVIERDLPQLEALARMRDLLPPAEIPGS